MGGVVFSRARIGEEVEEEGGHERVGRTVRSKGRESGWMFARTHSRSVFWLRFPSKLRQAPSVRREARQGDANDALKLAGLKTGNAQVRVCALT